MSGDVTVYGAHAVRHLLSKAPERVRRLQIAGEGHPDLAELARHADISVERVGRDALDRATGDGVHQGVVAWVIPVPPRDERALDDLLGGDRVPLLLVLDHVQDPHNLGACLRTADAVGVDAVIIPKDRAVGLTPTVRKVACGAAEWMPLVQVTNLARCLRELQGRGVWVVGTAGTADTSLYQSDLGGPLALVLGNEGDGLKRLTRETCDSLMNIPMVGAVESLNVSVACGIVLYEAMRQRTG
jgi:23S rRNA (guanosine2251-2'-O)-methyltransferase